MYVYLWYVSVTKNFCGQENVLEVCDSFLLGPQSAQEDVDRK